jgi:hypothetical protein
MGQWFLFDIRVYIYYVVFSLSLIDMVDGSMGSLLNDYQDIITIFLEMALRF